MSKHIKRQSLTTQPSRPLAPSSSSKRSLPIRTKPAHNDAEDKLKALDELVGVIAGSELDERAARDQRLLRQ